MPTAAQAQAVNDFVAQPINNLIVFAVIIALVIVLTIVFAVWKFAPALYKLYKQQAETNAKLTQIVGQNSDQAALATQSVDKNTTEMKKQTEAIEAQTTVISAQALDQHNYQTQVSNNLNAHTEQIAANTANIEALKVSIESLSEQIKSYLEANTNFAGVEQIVKNFRDEIIGIIQTEQARRATGTNPAVANGSQTAAEL